MTQTYYLLRPTQKPNKSNFLIPKPKPPKTNQTLSISKSTLKNLQPSSLSKMSASTVSMAASHAPAVASSSPLYNKLSNLFSYHLIPTHFPAKPIYPKPLKLNTQNPNSLSLRHFSPRFSIAFDSFQVEKDSETDDQVDPPETEDDEKQEQVEEEQEVIESSDGRLYVGNLPFVMTSSQLAEVFGKAGRVVNVEIVYGRVTDRSRGFAFVTMGSVEEAKEAIRMLNGFQVGGRTMKVNFPEVPRGGEREVMGPKIRSSYQGFVDSPHKIYAGNLSWGLTSQGLIDAFADQRGLLSGRVIFDWNSGRSLGFGFVTFETALDVKYALNAMKGVEVEGRPLRLHKATKRAPTAPPILESNSENNLDSSELLSSIST